MNNKYIGLNVRIIKELLLFFNTLDHLPQVNNPHSKATKTNNIINIVLSGDDNYAPMIAISGASILYNTTSYIKFYIISDCISEKNKSKILASLLSVSNNTSIEFLEINSKDYFSSLKLRNDHLTLATCNKLLVPTLLPDVDKVICLESDIIVVDDIAKLWNEKLNGTCIGAVPHYIDRINSFDFIYKKLNIQYDSNYKYFNAGVLLLDLKRMRDLFGNNQQIIDHLLKICDEINPDRTPDEFVLNRFAYLYGYSKLPCKYNACAQYGFEYIKKYNKNSYLYNSFTEAIKHLDYEDKDTNIPEDVCIIHWCGAQKPWKDISQSFFGNPVLPKFTEFWFYAKMTKYFNELKYNFLAKRFNDFDIGYEEDIILTIKKRIKCSILIIRWCIFKILWYILPFMRITISRKIENIFSKIRRL